ncbi:hypothetical protein CFC21_040733 [Triticum aestivum]|uniref:KIB1-4 beta-propeller domain-containing protein n=3 Tax=Triticum aestivum TaxID=4565 RepID=A0A9R1FI52_WHEAT|nr:hypothetical protein CFC21_040733 [Triticum aestivum]
MLRDVVTRGKRPRYRYSRFLNIATHEQIRMTIRGLDGRGGRLQIACTCVGLLVLVNKRTNGVFVLNPITGARADLPPLGSLLSSNTRDFVLPRAPGAGPLSAELTSDSAVVINFGGGGYQRMGIARPGDEHWTKVECEHRIGGSVLSFAGDVYCFTAGPSRTPLVLETSPDNPPRLVKSDKHPDDFINGFNDAISLMLA